MMPTVSIVIPAKNEAEFLPRSLSALLRTIKNYRGEAEIILVDNGSTDRTVEIAYTFGCKIIKDDAKTISALRNRGAESTTGEYIGFLDADCVVDESWLATCLQSFQTEEIGIVGTRAVPDFETATWVEDGWFRLVSGAERPDYPSWIGTSNMLMLRHLFFKAGCFDESLATAEDVNLCRKVLRYLPIKLEKRIDTLHLRESKTILQLIRKEIWRGKYSVREALANGTLSTGWKLNTFIFANVACIIGIAFSILALNPFFFIFLILNVLFPLIMIIEKKALIRSALQFVHVYIVGYSYILARTIALTIELFEILSQYIGMRKNIFSIFK